jgi:hypothetical protein
MFSGSSLLLHHVAKASSFGPSPPDGLSFMNLPSSPHLSLELLLMPIIILVRSINLQTNLDTRLSLCYSSFPLPITSIRRLHLLLITQLLSSSFAELSIFARCMYELCGVTLAAVLLWLFLGPSQITICCSEQKKSCSPHPSGSFRGSSDEMRWDELRFLCRRLSVSIAS